MQLIKCHICKLDINTCDQICIDMEDVSSLYKDGMTEKDAIPDGFCTNHQCPNNPSGFKCEVGHCIFGLIED
ncbi:MAG: hypothetical protein IJZ79_03575 [Bacilli bacterium]|nr:hypothetical protein [Bacilli bacterium]MBQ8218809.1 hypothetical protein [Bacilli bacterium]